AAPFLNLFSRSHEEPRRMILYKSVSCSSWLLRAFVKSVKPIRLACHDSRAAAQPREQLDEIGRQRRLELQRPLVYRVAESEAIGVERLAPERHGAQQLRSIDVPPLTDQRVAAQPGLNPYLVALPRHQPHFDQGRVAEGLEDAVLADRLFAPRIARMRLFLDQRAPIPHQMIAPGAGRRTRASVHDRAIHSLGLMALELLPQPVLRQGDFGEHDESRL